MILIMALLNTAPVLVFLIYSSSTLCTSLGNLHQQVSESRLVIFKNKTLVPQSGDPLSHRRSYLLWVSMVGVYAGAVVFQQQQQGVILPGKQKYLIVAWL